MLIWWERDRLAESNINGLLARILFIRRPAVSGPDKKSWLWLGAGILTGMIMGIIAAYIFSHYQTPNLANRESISVILASPELIIKYLSLIILLPVIQMVLAGALEEPLFRGFLWGALRRSRWKDGWICLFQASLFCLGHIYYIPLKLYWSFALTFIGAVVFGILAWRSRSIATSIAAHGFDNGWADIFSHMIKW